MTDATPLFEHVYYDGKRNLFVTSIFPPIYYVWELKRYPEIVYLGEL